MAGRGKVTIDQIALKAGVSRSVVSRVLNNRPRVSRSTRARVLEVIAEHNYHPSAVARSLATDRAYEICIIAPRRRQASDLASGFWPLLHLGISEACFERGYCVSLAMISPDTDAAALQRILHERVFDGYLLVTQEITDLVVPTLAERAAPAVLIGHDLQCAHLPSVDVDNQGGAYAATRHLLGLGYDRVAAILADLHLIESQERQAGYRAALRDAGRAGTEEVVVVETYAERWGYEVARRWVKERAWPRALFCASDSIAAGALLAFYEGGVDVPEDVAIVGFDDLPNAQYAIPPLTTVWQPVYEKGWHAADLLIRQVEGADVERTHVALGTRLVVRRSCGAQGSGPC